MADDVIPADVREFLLARIDSIAQLEALLLLHGAPDAIWSVAEVAKRLYIGEQETGAVLARLAADALAAAVQADLPGYVYRPASPALAQDVDRVAETYRTHLVPVTNLIHGKARTRVREFADAFRLRKEG
jgi:hypothetical protein